jgi:hypothetical protein
LLEKRDYIMKAENILVFDETADCLETEAFALENGCERQV